MSGKKRIDDLSRIKPDNRDNAEQQVDNSNAVLTERLANCEARYKEACLRHKRTVFLLALLAVMFFMLFLESVEQAAGWVLIGTGGFCAAFIIWQAAKWAGFRPAARRLGYVLDSTQAAFNEKMGGKHKKDKYEPPDD